MFYWKLKSVSKQAIVGSTGVCSRILPCCVASLLPAPVFLREMSSFAGPLPFSTTQFLTSQTTAPAISSNMETTITPPPKPTTSAWLTPRRWKPKTRYEHPLRRHAAGWVGLGGHGSSDWLTQVDYMRYLPVNLVSSHPHYDTEGNAYNIGTSIAEKGKTKYVLFKVPAAAAKGIWPLLWPTSS